MSVLNKFFKAPKLEREATVTPPIVLKDEPVKGLFTPPNLNEDVGPYLARPNVSFRPEPFERDNKVFIQTGYDSVEELKFDTFSDNYFDSKGNRYSSDLLILGRRNGKTAAMKEAIDRFEIVRQYAENVDVVNNKLRDIMTTKNGERVFKTSDDGKAPIAVKFPRLDLKNANRIIGICVQSEILKDQPSDDEARLALARTMLAMAQEALQTGITAASAQQIIDIYFAI